MNKQGSEVNTLSILTQVKAVLKIANQTDRQAQARQAGREKAQAESIKQVVTIQDEVYKYQSRQHEKQQMISNQTTKQLEDQA